MKPGPFENIDRTDPQSHLRIVSTQRDREKNPDDNGHTLIYGADGKLLWELPEFIGRYKTDLSPDGQYLALTGNYFFTHVISLSPKEQLLAVYKKGTLVKKVIFSDLFKEDPEKLAKDLDIPVMGGDWAPMKAFIKEISLDWKSHQAVFVLHDGSSKSIHFE